MHGTEWNKLFFLILSSIILYAYLCAKFQEPMRNIICCILALALFSCGHSELLNKIEKIKAVGDSDPETAQLMADSIYQDVRHDDVYVQKKYDLLRIRLDDKAYKLAKSDIMIRELVPYFEENGTEADLQEVYYYAGSVYRDLQDTPRAMEYFLKASETTGDIDSIMLRNTYSQLQHIYYNVQDYPNALINAEQEYQIAKKLNNLDETTIYHCAISYSVLDSLDQATKYCNEAIEHIASHNTTAKNQQILARILYESARQRDTINAIRTYELYSQIDIQEHTALDYFALGAYYRMQSKPEEAIECYKACLNCKNNEENRYEAYRRLFAIYYNQGDYTNAARYGAQFVLISDTLNLGKRQEMAATANNMHQYHRDKEREQRLKDEAERYHTTIQIVVALALLVGLLGCIYHFRKRNKHLRDMLRASAQIEDVRHDASILQQELAKARQELQRNKDDLAQAKEENRKTEDELRIVTMQLRDRLQQNQTLMQMLHQNKLAAEAEDIVLSIRKAASGIRKLSQEEWDVFYTAVDNLYPTYKEALIQRIDSLNEKQMRVCYLLRIGLGNSDIQKLTDTPRTTLHRWIKQYRDTLSDFLGPAEDSQEED